VNVVKKCDIEQDDGDTYDGEDCPGMPPLFERDAGEP
jgi:hypothetical protein